MITKLLTPLKQGYKTYPAGTPVAFLSFESGDCVMVQLPNGATPIISARRVEAGHEPEETLAALAETTGVQHDTLRRAAVEGRLLARKSGGTWLSTRTAVEWYKNK